jgi:hypothetical protein
MRNVFVGLCGIVAALVAAPSCSFAQTANGCFATEKATSIDGTSLLCTQVYQLNGPCNGTDAVYEVKIGGTPTQTDWRIKVWEPKPILIRALEIAQAAGGAIDWAMVGNNTWPDIMLMLGRGMSYARVVFPAGTAMPLPAKAVATDRDYLDFHIQCTGDPFSFLLRLEYTEGKSVP